MHYYAGMTSEHCLRVITRIYRVPSWCSRALYSPVPLASTASVFNDCPPVSRVLVNRLSLLYRFAQAWYSQYSRFASLFLVRFSQLSPLLSGIGCKTGSTRWRILQICRVTVLLLLYLTWSQKRTFNPWYCRRTFQLPFICFLHTPCQAFTPIYNGGRVRSIEIFFIYLS